MHYVPAPGDSGISKGALLTPLFVNAMQYHRPSERSSEILSDVDVHLI